MYIAFYAALWDTFSTPQPDLDGAIETVRPGAFADALAAKHPVPLKLNHVGAPLASTGPGLSLQLEEDRRGLLAVAWIADGEGGRELLAGVKAGRVAGGSFSFSKIFAQTSEYHDPQRGRVVRLNKVKCLVDVALIAGGRLPAYRATSGHVRAWPS